MNSIAQEAPSPHRKYKYSNKFDRNTSLSSRFERFVRFERKCVTGKILGSWVKASKGSASINHRLARHPYLLCGSLRSPDAAAIISRRNYLPSAVNCSETTLCVGRFRGRGGARQPLLCASYNDSEDEPNPRDEI